MVAGLLGAATAGLLLIKINVGLFFGIGCALALLSFSPQGGFWKVARVLVAVASFALPAWFFRQKLDLPWGLFCGCTCAGLGCCLWAAGASCPRRIMGFREAFWFLAGGTMAAVPLLGFSFAVLGSPLETFDALVLQPSRAFGGGRGSLSIELSIAPQIAIASGLAGMIAACCALRGGPGAVLSASLDPLDQAGGCRLRVLRDAGQPRAGRFVHPCLRLAGTPDAAPPRPWTRRDSLSPAARIRHDHGTAPGVSCRGSGQALVGDLGILLIGVLCLIDWAESVGHLFATRGAAIAAAGLSVIGLLSFVQLGNAARYNVDRFQHCVPVSFPGCTLTRLPLNRAMLYRWLVDNVRHADAFVGKVGYQSLNFWADQEPLTRRLIGWSWRAAPEPVQAELVDVYQRAGDVLAIDFSGAIDYYRWDKTTFGKYVLANFRPVARWGDFTLWRKNEFLNKPVAGCAVDPMAARRQAEVPLGERTRNDCGAVARF